MLPIIILFISAILTIIGYAIIQKSNNTPEVVPSTAELDKECDHGRFYYDSSDKCLYITGFGLTKKIHREIKNVIKSSSFAEPNSSTYMLLDETNRRVLFAQASKDNIDIIDLNFDQILGVEIIEDGETTYKKNVVGRALAGAVIAGGAGAIVGGMSGKTKQGGYIYSYKIQLALQDMTNPICEIELLQSELDLHSAFDRSIYSSIKAFASHVKAIISSVINLNNKVVNLQEEKKNNSYSVAEELKKLAELKELGIITEKEFSAQKKKLLMK